MNSPNNTDSQSQTEDNTSLITSDNEVKNLPQGSGESPSDDSNRWFDSVHAVTKHNLESAADASAEFVRDNPWKMIAICAAAGVALGVLLGLR